MLTNGIAVALLSVRPRKAPQRITPPAERQGAPGRGRAASGGRGRRPHRRGEAALAVARALHRCVAGLEVPVPELAGDLLVALVEPLAVVRELAATHEVAVPEA